MKEITLIDLRFFDVPETVACFLIQGKNYNILVETGPASTVDQLKAALKVKGLELNDITHVLLTHIHFDHAGAAWILAESGAKIFVHPSGKPHLIEPGKLYHSAKRLYGDQMESLWGDIQAISEEKVIACKDGEPILDFVPIFTPGHASHHIAWQWKDNIFTGDVGGVKLSPNGPIIPPCPPPDIDLNLWLNSIEILILKKPKNLWLTHFGKISNPETHLINLKHELLSWVEWVREKSSQENLIQEFKLFINEKYNYAGLLKEEILKYEVANPTDLSLKGILRYLQKSTDG